MNLRLGGLLLLLPLTALADLPILEISGANFRPMPVAVPAPMVSPEAKAASVPFDESFQFDLKVAGIFQLLERKGFLADSKEGFTAAGINFKRWADVGAEALIKVQLSAQGSNLHGELRLFGVATGKEEYKTDETVPMTDGRKLAHMLA